MGWTVAIGVDTHKHAHMAVALDVLGRRLGSCELATSPTGYAHLLAWARTLGRPAFAIEGTGHWGAGLTRSLYERGASVCECERPARRERRRGKSDLVDAELAARRLVAGDRLARPRRGGARERLRLLLLERRGARRARTAALNQLHAAAATAPDELRERLPNGNGDQLAGACLRLRARACPQLDGAVRVLRRLARRAQLLDRELAEVERELDQLVTQLTPTLARECGVGPVCAAQLVVSAGDPTRMRTEASFAALAGTSPVEASSGQHQRHRLNRGGDRQLNWALHIIALNRVRFHAETHAYSHRLRSHGKTNREALRCVKRALARRLYRLLLKEEALLAA
jgi:transposase